MKEGVARRYVVFGKNEIGYRYSRGLVVYDSWRSHLAVRAIKRTKSPSVSPNRENQPMQSLVVLSFSLSFWVPKMGYSCCFVIMVAKTAQAYMYFLRDRVLDQSLYTLSSCDRAHTPTLFDVTHGQPREP